MPFGPRLDRPSAVGTEGRPRATSLGVAALVTVAVVVATGVAVGDPGLFGGVGLLVGLTVAGVALADRERPVEAVVGHLLFLPAASLLVAVVVLQPSFVRVGVVLALAGVASGYADVADAETVSGALETNLLAYVFGFVGLFAVGAVALGARLTVGLAGGLASAGGGPVALAVLGVLVAVACGCLVLAVRTVPAVDLAPASRHDEVAGYLRRVQRGLAALAGLAMAGALILVALAVGTRSSPVAGPLSSVGETVTSGVVVVPVFAVAGLAVLVSVLSVAVERAGRTFDAGAGRGLVATLAGAGYVVFVGTLALPVVTVTPVGYLVVAVAVVVPLAVYAVAAAWLVVLRLGVVSDRTMPPGLTAAGLVCLAVGAAAADLPHALVFAAVAAAMVAWDAGTFGLGLTAELGHRPGTRRLELYHGVLAVAVGAVAVAVVTALDAARSAAGSGLGTPQTVALATLGVVILLVLVRG